MMKTKQNQGEKLTMAESEVKPLNNGTKEHGQDPGNNTKMLEIKIRKSDPNVLVKDSAYCWVICFASFVIYLLAAAFNRALTISFLDFVRIFDVSITTTSLSFTFLLVAISISSLLVMNILVPMTGERTAVVAGCVGNSLCTIGVGLSPNITVFLLCMAGKGLFTGTAFVPAISMISQYFEKRRSIATSLAYCGLGVGSMAAPPLVEYLRETYGLVGMFLIVGALEMNAVPAAMLMRPLSTYKYVISSADSVSVTSVDDEEIDIEGDRVELAVVPEKDDIKQSDWKQAPEDQLSSSLYEQKSQSEIYSQSYGNDVNGFNRLNANDATQRDRADTISTPNEKTRSKSRSTSFRDESSNVYQDTTEPLLKDGGHRPPLLRQSSVDAACRHRASTMGDSEPFRNSATVIEEADDSALNPTVQALTPKTNRRQKPTFMRGISSTWSVASAPMSEMPLDVEVLAIETAERRSQMSGLNRAGIHIAQADNSVFLGDTADIVGDRDKPTWCEQTGAIFREMFSKELLKTWSLIILLLGSCAGSIVQYLLAYLPTLASKQGMSASQVSVLLTTSGAVELVSRILIGLFTDLNILTPGQVVAISQIAIGTTMHFVYFFTDFNSLMVLSIITGIFANIRQNLATLITIEFMGLARFRRALGFQAMSATLSLAIHHPLLSAILEATGSFGAPLHYVGVSMYIAAALVFMAPLTKRWDEKAEARRQQSLNSEQA